MNIARQQNGCRCTKIGELPDSLLVILLLTITQNASDSDYDTGDRANEHSQLDEHKTSETQFIVPLGTTLGCLSMLVLQVECVQFVPRTKKMDKEGEGDKSLA
jgi:hypothetical protein